MKKPQQLRAVTGLLLYFLCQSQVVPHGVGPLGMHVLDWHTDELSRVVTAARSMGNLGLTVLGSTGEVIEMQGRRCIRGTLFNLDVHDELAFDVDQSVPLEIDFDVGNSPDAFVVAWDANGGPGNVSVDLPETNQGGFHTARVMLERARFAGRGDFKTDVMIAGIPDARSFLAKPMTICGVRIQSGFDQTIPREPGWLELTVRDERGEITPARLGLYDETGRTPLPSSAAMEFEEFDDRTRMVLLREEPGTANWPSGNRWVFYTTGEYRARVPSGTYKLIVSRGPEYSVQKLRVRIEPGETRQEEINLARWTHLPERGWYSGDVHIHMAQRDVAESQAILTQARAEDLHVANSLRMGNPGTIHYPQRHWGEEGWFGTGNHTVVPGQEDPRTNIRGHTIHLDIPEPVRNSDRYLMYHEVFEQVSELGGISGYAHIGTGGTQAGDVGLAIDVPFGLVDFVEVFQAGGTSTDVWFDFLNLGYRLAPAAGSDYPYLGHVGEVRSYVHMPDGYSPDAWFEGLANGRTFATNGPIVEMDLNGMDIGSRLELTGGDEIAITAMASTNPDIDLLERIELIEQGDVIAETVSENGAGMLELEYSRLADHGTWFVIRATGRTESPTVFGPVRKTMVISAPIYVSVDGQRTWKRGDVQGLAGKRIADLDRLLNTTADNAASPEPWQVEPEWSEAWAAQLDLLRGRIEDAKAKYNELIDLAGD